LIYVVGCNHGIQPIDRDVWDTPKTLEQRAHFRKLITQIIKENDQFVGEEWGLPTMTIAHAAAAENGKILWANINTSDEELDSMKIPRDYVNGRYPAEQKERWHRQREQVIMKKITEQKGNAKQFVIICGFEHMQPLRDSLRKIYESVESVDYRTMNWYDKHAFPD
jgi:hypothetical protein